MIYRQINISLAAALNKIMRFSCIFYFMSLVEPRIFSQWVIISLILQYSIFLQAGTPFSLHREASIALGQKEEGKIKSIISSSLRNYILSLFILSLLLIIFDYNNLLAYTFIYVTIVNFGNLLLLQSRALFEDKKATYALIMDTVIFTFLTLVLIENYSLKGLLISFSAGSLAYLIYCMPKLKLLFRIFAITKIEIRESFRLIKFGIPLLIYNFLLTVKDTWDILIVSKFYTDYLDFYSPAQIFGSGIRVFAGLIGIVLLPNMAREFGKSNEKISRTNFYLARKATAFLAICFILFSIFFYPILSALVEMLIPQYNDSIQLIYSRTTAIFLGIVPLPIVMLLNSARKTRISITLALYAAIISLISFYLLNLRLELILSLIYSLFIGNIAFLIIAFYVLSSQVQRKDNFLDI